MEKKHKKKKKEQKKKEEPGWMGEWVGDRGEGFLLYHARTASLKKSQKKMLGD